MYVVDPERFQRLLHGALGTRPTQDDMYMPRGLAEALAVDAVLAGRQAHSPRAFLDDLVGRVEATVFAKMRHPHPREICRNRAVDCALAVAGLPPQGNNFWRSPDALRGTVGPRSTGPAAPRR